MGEVPTTAPGLKDITVAREITGMSPPKLMMMSLVREIDIAIDVVLGTAPTSTTPY